MIIRRSWKAEVYWRWLRKCAMLSSQVNTLPIAKSQTRSKQNKGMHEFRSVYSERGVLLPVLTSGGEWVGVQACKNATRVPPSLCNATQTSDPANPPPCACWARLRDVCSTRPMRTVGPGPLHPHVGTTFTMKMNSNDKILCEQYVNKQVIHVLRKKALKVWLESVFTYNFNFVVCLGYRNITIFPYRPSLRFQWHVPRNLYVRVR